MPAELAQTGWLQLGTKGSLTEQAIDTPLVHEGMTYEGSQAFDQQIVETTPNWRSGLGLLAKAGVVIGIMLPTTGALSATAAEARPRAGVVPGLGIDGANIGATPDQVKKDLGKPIRSLHNRGETILNYASPLYMTITFSKGHLNGVLTSSKQLKTSKGVGVGSSPEAVKGAYPQAKCTPGAGPGGPQSLACIIKSKLGSSTVETAFEFTTPAAGVEEIDIDKV